MGSIFTRKRPTMAATQIAVLLLAAFAASAHANAHGHAHGDGICGYHFPAQWENANVIARNYDQPLNLSALTINYWVYIESHTNPAHTLSAMFQLTTGSIRQSTMIEPLETDYDIPLELRKWYQITYTWTSTNGRYNLYVDGHLKALGFTDAGVITVDAVNQFMVLGQKLESAGEPCENSQELVFVEDKRFIGYIAHFQMWDVELTGDNLEDVLSHVTDLSVYPDIPDDDLFTEPFLINDGAESYWHDCRMCPNETIPEEKLKCAENIWGYVAWDLDENDAAMWGSQCASPNLISPIDVDLDALKDGGDSVMDASSCRDVTLSDYRLENNQHTVMITLKQEDSENAVLCFGTHNYTIQKLWFHWPSEHMIDGDRVPLELKLEMSDTLLGGKHIASILFRLGSTADPFITNVIPALQLARTPIVKDFGSPNLPQISLALLRDLVESHDHLLAYTGTGTFPPCDSNISYMLLESRYTKVTSDQMAEFHCITRCQLDPNIYRQNPYMFGNYRAVKSISQNVDVFYYDLNTQ